ncbi:MAG TPA: molybdopterin-binding protein [Candidatus Limnocylindria bacterium]|nr:molybdopterin-binding protein [Candidatus Limnocylindria bacterium]
MAAIRTAELLSIGTELTVGETRDTNAGDLARDLTRRGVVVNRITALPDDLAAVTAAFGDALARADLVVSTGGLGPTPDDLTREAIAGLVGESPTVDPALEVWLRELFERRSLVFPEANLKQAWLIPSATAIPNENGTAPGWFVKPGGARAGRIIVALPGPPREMRPMWDGWVVPRLEERGLGRPLASVTLRLTGIGESAIADKLGDRLLAGRRPMVATYARADAVDIRIWAHDGPVSEPGAEADPGGAEAEAAGADDSHAGSAAEVVGRAEAQILALVGDHVWARGDTTWPGAVGEALRAKGWRLAAVEVGMRGALLALLGEGLGETLGFGEILAARLEAHDGQRATLEDLAARAREEAGSEVGFAVEARERGGDTSVTVAVLTPESTHRETRVVFLGGQLGRGRAAIAAAAILLSRLR